MEKWVWGTLPWERGETTKQLFICRTNPHSQLLPTPLGPGDTVKLEPTGTHKSVGQSRGKWKERCFRGDSWEGDLITSLHIAEKFRSVSWFLSVQIQTWDVTRFGASIRGISLAPNRCHLCGLTVLECSWAPRLLWMFEKLRHTQVQESSGARF